MINATPPNYGIPRYSVCTSAMRVLLAVLKEDEGLASEQDRKYVLISRIRSNIASNRLLELDRIELRLKNMSMTLLADVKSDNSEEGTDNDQENVVLMVSSESNKKKLVNYFSNKRQAIAQALKDNNRTYMKHVFLYVISGLYY